MLVFADYRKVRSFELVSRDVKILWCGFVLEDTTGKIIGRAVTRAKKAARPVVRKIGLRPRLESGPRRATKVCTNADYDKQILSLCARTILVVAVCWQRN